MNIELSQLIEALRRSLADEVRPELSTDHARGQLAAVLDILGKVERMAVWSPDAAAQQASVLAQGCAAFAARLALAGVELPPAAPAPAADLQAAEARVMQLTDWLFDAGETLPAPLRDELDAILRQALREQLLVQRKLIPLTDFGAMTAAARP
ncbi:MAG: hypothetical protein AB7S86_02495 [Hydrogenophaga sp.]|uniref:hypothetical protein n=1 Tax=Hydrogenophaga sp. TaxID=1904254 RepID=UPI003D0AFD9B